MELKAKTKDVITNTKLTFKDQNVVKNDADCCCPSCPICPAYCCSLGCYDALDGSCCPEDKLLALGNVVKDE